MSLLLVFLMVFSAVRQNTIFEESRTVYDEEIGETNSTLITIDRDYYQAQYANENVFNNWDRPGEEETVSDGKKEYAENLQQVKYPVFRRLLRKMQPAVRKLRRLRRMYVWEYLM